MARTKAAANTAPVTVTRDAVDLLVEKLNEIPGIDFVKDAWENKAPETYGVVEMADQAMAQWADDRMVEQAFSLTVHLYCTDGSNAWIRRVQDKLAECTDWYNMLPHEYAWEIGKNHWSWNAYIIGPLQWEEVNGDGTV